MSKYPRTYHLPWSPGGTSDDKKLKSVDSFLSKELVITEKLDGANSCLSPQGVFARSHGKITSHPAFDHLKGLWGGIVHLLEEDEEIFGENCFAVHSIAYNELSAYFYVFNIRKNNRWLSFDEVEKRSQELGLSVVPILYRGSIKKESDLERLTESFMKNPSQFGGPIEGMVIRIASGFPDEDFSKSVAKYVRANHVQTDDHWKYQQIVKQTLKK